MKPTTIRKKMLYAASQHLQSKQLGSHLSKDLKEKYHCSSMRVIEGDSVKVLRGEFKGIEGKVTRVSTEKRGIAIEGIKREKLKGGNVDIYIHPSNVIITSLNLEDKWRQSRLEGQKPKTAKVTSSPENKETKPKEQKEAKKEKPKETKNESKSDDKKDKSKNEKKGTK
ncbi:50S ribosomal protein L24P [Nitrosotalea sinensis]|jgi:large subunit ribosomal protein L24|uniref:Large ribosomal subunit protein uL24 n=1 Tax=Nitrosotalea sinensis TaxID=1499975 RepID=A0A2H1EHW3_9ARCH|nr:50S ribosomal protein L24 [Candidatus Nitrosotalea sinensis]SHO46853.1 50S ribosomal protein L24P [Candidatus Nitrosotalea sinensis]